MGKIGFVFAGQGAQYPGMGKDLYEYSPSAKKLFDIADTMRPGTMDQCFNASKEELSLTINTQPCLFLIDFVCAALVEEQAGILPDMVAGFSLGEVAALAYTGILSFRDAFKFIGERARLMHECATEHRSAMMAVLRLNAEDVTTICADFDAVFPVNFNCPGQTVVAGKEEQLPAFEERVVQAGGRVMKLAVSGGFHSPFMDRAAQGVFEYLKNTDRETSNYSEVPVYSNKTALPYKLEDVDTLLSSQVNSPVLWERTIRNMIDAGCTTFVEVGAGKTISGLIKKIDGSVEVMNVQDVPSLLNVVEKLKGGSNAER